MFIKELKIFSRENWWVYLLLSIALTIVYITGKWNLVEIIILFLLNFLWNLFVMVAMWNYQEKNNKIWSIYHVSTTLTFTIISIYWAFFLDQFQYLFWQITYLIAAIKAISYYKFEHNIKFFTPYLVGGINIILMSLFIYLFPFSLFGTIQAIWFSFVTIGLVSITDKFRFYMSFIWVFFITSWSAIWLYTSYLNENIDWIALGYFLLTISVLVYHIKLLPKYLNVSEKVTI
jgi:hypothetical protein